MLRWDNLPVTYTFSALRKNRLLNLQEKLGSKIRIG